MKIINKILLAIPYLLDEVGNIRVPKLMAVSARIVSLIALLMMIPYMFLAALWPLF